MAFPILLGNKKTIIKNGNSLGINFKKIIIKEMPGIEEIERLSADYIKNGGGLSRFSIKKRLEEPLYYGAILLKNGEADSMVVGLNYTTYEVVMASQTIIGMQPGINTPSSLFIMDIPGYKGEYGNLIVFADCGLCIDPAPDELADITISTAKSVRELLDWEPKVANAFFFNKRKRRTRINRKKSARP